ncbi:MAG: hypothetical protein J5J06_14270 [Phycisphaerae bacterium]|nr:hypothetical protein [Phycisphaerae bacterium]
MVIRKKHFHFAISARWRVSLAVCIGAILTVSQAATAQSPVERFIDELDRFPTLPADARELIREGWRKCDGCDPAEFLTQGLALLSPSLREGLVAYDQGDYPRCLDVMARLRDDENLFVATHAAVYEIKSLVALDRPVAAGPLIDRLLEDGGTALQAYTYATAEISFLHGISLLADLQYDAAAEVLEGFLSDYPGAPQRLTISAEQILAELANFQPGKIGEVVDLMDYSRRSLGGGSLGDVLHERQDRIIDLLDRLIKQAEQQEKSGQSGSSQSQNQNGGQQQKQQPGQRQGSAGGTKEPGSNPAPYSQLPGGDGNQDPTRGGRRANPAEAWGSLPPAERERILQALRDSFPSRYRQLVEQYYEELAKKP